MRNRDCTFGRRLLSGLDASRRIEPKMSTTRQHMNSIALTALEFSRLAHGETARGVHPVIHRMLQMKERWVVSGAAALAVDVVERPW